MEQAPSHLIAMPSLALETPRAPGPLRTPIVEQYWQALRTHKWLVAGIIAGCLALGLILTLLMTPKYTATSRIEISRQQENVTNVEGLEDKDVGQSLEFYQTQYSLLESRSLAERVARALNLANDRTFVQAYGLEDEKNADISAKAPRASDARNKRIVDILLDNIDISPIRSSALVDVSYTAPNPALSAKIANAWTDQFIAANLDRRFASTADARKFLEDQLQKLRTRLEESEANLVNYSSSKRIIPLSTTQSDDGKTQTQQTLVASDLQALNTELASATAARIQAESAYRQSGVTEGALDNPAVNALRQQRALVEADYAKMLAQFQPDYPPAQALKSQLRELDRGIAREEGRSRSRVGDAYQEAVRRESQLRSKVNALEDQLIQQNRDSIQYAIDQREVDTNRELYNALLQRYKEIGVAGVGSNNVAVVDRANTPQKPSSPKLAVNLAIMLLLGLAISGGALVLLEYMDQSLKDPHDVDRLLGLPLLGAIPRVRDQDVAEDLNDRKSLSSEAYLSVKTNLSFLTDHGVPRSLMLTSTAPNEGKSVSALAIARTLGRTGSSVILVDADMRNPSVGSLTDIQNKQGLTNYLSGMDDWRSLLVDAGHDGFVVMPAGPIPPNAAELLSTNRMHKLVTELVANFDHVIVDSPPILGLADAPLISATVEGVILMIEANKHRLRAIENSLRRLQNANANVLGAIVTKLDERNSSYGYGYGYGYGYEYGSKRSASASAG